MSRINLLVVHCAATPNGERFTVDDIRRWHTDAKPNGNGWRVPGYHTVIEIGGQVSTLLRIDENATLEPDEIANGVRGFNDRAVHVCLIGTDRFTAAQWHALTAFTLQTEQRFPGVRIVGHRELNPNKTCPGFDVPQWLTNGRGIVPNNLFPPIA